VTEGSPLDRTTRDAAAPSKRMNGDRVMASPYVRKTARELGINLQGAVGTGPGGRVVAGDLASMKQDVAGSTALAKPAAGAPTLVRPEPRLAEPEARPLSMMRKTIARRLTESKQTVPHFYLQIDVEASALAALREQINAELAAPEKKNGAADGASAQRAARSTQEDAKPLKVSINDLLVKACAVALVRVPECNATFSPEAILVHRRVDVSVAVAIPDGLVTPVVRNADQKSVVAIAAEVRELAARARAKKLKPEEMADGTFSISNLGMFGIDQFSAVINPPEGAILAVGQVRDEPVVVAGQVVAGKRLAMTLSCDHRVIDGAVGAAFLAELRSLVEHPMRILTG
jgi:pyruvate dehydrogenase E2 component (dihydrolipoamide acetyltransferase)